MSNKQRFTNDADVPSMPARRKLLIAGPGSLQPRWSLTFTRQKKPLAPEVKATCTLPHRINANWATSKCPLSVWAYRT